MPANHERDQLDAWLDEQVRPLPPPPGTFELITRRARRRRIRKAVISAASAAAVAAAVAVAVPVSLSLQTSDPAHGSLSAGSPTATAGSPGPAGGSSPVPDGTGSPAATSPASGGLSGSSAPVSGGYLPPGFLPSSVTWDSLSTGWVMGPAGTPGKCANADPTICTSIARTDDGGQTWHGLPAPDAGGPRQATGVSGLRFLNGRDGWAFGPDLWATTDGSRTWHKVAAGGAAVTDLETSNGRAYALFGQCRPPAGTTGDTIANCTSYTLKAAAAGSDDWTDVPGVPSGLAPAVGAGSALLVLAGPAGNSGPTGYLAAPDGTLYAGPLDGGAWHQVAALPCSPGGAANDGLPGSLMLAAAGATSAGGARLALTCAPTANDTVAYRSDDGGATWARQSGAGTGGTAHLGTPQSLAALPDGTLILATQPSAAAKGGIYLLGDTSSARWRPASLADRSGAADGFSYVGMTSATQGVALGGDPGLHAVWMTSDGGQSWQVRPISP